jgi:sigma-B regulation protein RsbU (phosphoserine phosphatase)
MAAHPKETARVPGVSAARRLEALEVLADAGVTAAAAPTLRAALSAVAAGAARAARADVAVVRVVDPTAEWATACAVASESPAVAAELEGTRFPASAVRHDETDELAAVPEAISRAAKRIDATAVLVVPIQTDDEPAGCLELLRDAASFTAAERAAARLAAAQAGLVIRRFRGGRASGGPDAALTLVGDAFAAVAEGGDAGVHIARLAARATGALVCLLWLRTEAGVPALLASSGLAGPEPALVDAGEAVQRAWGGRDPVAVESLPGRLPGGAGVAATLTLGQPTIGALQLLFGPEVTPTGNDLKRLATFGVRAAQVLRAGDRARTTAAELDRTRALLGVVAEAIAQLSLAHTLETVVERVAELLDLDRVAVYLLRERRLESAGGIGLAGPHVRLAERLLELVLGPFRGRGLLSIANVAADPRVGGAADAAAEAGIESVIALPLLVREEAIGLLAVFPPRGRLLTESESALLSALATQLAVAVQNAQLHEETKRLGEEREQALDSERAAARQLRALYEISRSFAQSLSLDATVEAVARTVTDVLDVELAVIYMPDEKGESLVPRALHVVDPRMEDVVQTLVGQPLAFGTAPVQQLFRLLEPVRLGARNLTRIGGSATALIPFIRRGWTGALVPIATAAEVVGALLVISMRPGRRVDANAIENARRIGGQAALAIDNARLYQQQKQFADTMQRSLLPRTRPTLPGLDVGDAYESSARVEVGGDVYDYLELDDGKLSVVLGDVTGHGIDAAADMAMAKFVFRSLAREHPAPSAFLQAANDVVVGEIAPAKFITMVYLLVDPELGVIVGAGAGHPQPRIVAADGSVRALDVHGLVLGIEANQRYEERQAPLEPGGFVVLYTDGVIEARRDGELYGFERLDAIVSAARGLSARDIAETILADCRDFAANELTDDCAVVVIKRLPRE